MRWSRKNGTRTLNVFSRICARANRLPRKGLRYPFLALQVRCAAAAIEGLLLSGDGAAAVDRRVRKARVCAIFPNEQTRALSSLDAYVTHSSHFSKLARFTNLRKATQPWSSSSAAWVFRRGCFVFGVFAQAPIIPGRFEPR